MGKLRGGILKTIATMKNLFKNLMLVAVAAMAFTACQNEPEMDINAVEKTVITFDAKFDDTRSAFGELNGETETFSSYWEGNEVAKFNHWSVSNGNYEDVNVTIDSEDRFVVEFAREIDNTHTIDAYVPASAWSITKSDWELDSNDDPYYNDVYREYTIPAEQNPTATSVDPKAHILKASVVFDSSNSYSLVFKHQVAYGKLNLKNFAGTGVTSYVLDINGDKYVINSENTTGVWFACKPAEVENMTLSVVASEGTYTKPLVENGNKALEFVKGQVAEFTVNMVDATTGEVVDTFNPNILATNLVWDGSYFKMTGDVVSGTFWGHSGDYIRIYINSADRPNNKSIKPGSYTGCGSSSPQVGEFGSRISHHWGTVIYPAAFGSTSTLDVKFADGAYTVILTHEGTTYGYKGMPDGWEAPAGGGTPEPVKLAAPTATATDITAESITVSWDAVANASGYAVAINGGAEQSVATTSCTFSGLEAETDYVITVVAKGNGTDYLDSAAATVNAKTEAAAGGGDEGDDALAVTLTFFADNGYYIFKGSDGCNYLLGLRSFDTGVYDLSDNTQVITATTVWTDSNTKYQTFQGTPFQPGDTLELTKHSTYFSLVIRATVNGKKVVATCANTTF